MSSLAGCRKKQLSSVEIRGVTRELVFAAKNVTGGKAEIGMQPESPPRAASQPSSGRAAGAPADLAADHIYITLPAGRSGQADPGTLAALEKEFDRAASRHGLQRVNLPGAPGVVRFDYRLGDRRTHAIHIITPLATRPETPRGSIKGSGGRLAIIIDDLGYDRSAAEALFALHFPLTVAVLPNLPHSTDLAEEASRRGYQVLLHLPMESSNGGARPEAMEMRLGMTPEDVTRVLAEMLETVPHAVGVNNHQGSLATADEQLMAAIMPALRERQLFFIDSRTTTTTVAYDAAVRAGVPAASRKVFLDDIPTRDAVREQLARAARHARKDGFAIAIGHPHPATLQALGEYLPQLEAHRISLVFASALVR